MDNETMFTLAAAWRAALVADGFTLEPTYGNSEPIERACTGRTADGWVVMMIARPAGEPSYQRGPARRRPEWSINAWAPDTLAVNVPDAVDVAALRANVDKCGYCRKRGPTVRLGFAGRACPECRAAKAPTVERPGWCD